MTDDYDRPADWGSNRMATARELRYAVGKLGVLLWLTMAIVVFAISVGFYANGYTLTGWLVLLIAMAYITIAWSAMTDGLWRRVWARVKTYNSPPLDEIEPEYKRTPDVTTGDELLRDNK